MGETKMTQHRKVRSCILVSILLSILLILYPPRLILDLRENLDYSIEIHYPKKKIFDYVI